LVVIARRLTAFTGFAAVLRAFDRIFPLLGEASG
jgi:hypothetical protein